jgi:hypothetical protein
MPVLGILSLYHIKGSNGIVPAYSCNTSFFQSRGLIVLSAKNTTFPKMSVKLAKVRLVKIDYSSLTSNDNPRATIAIEAQGPLEPEGNKNTRVEIDRDSIDLFKFILHYGEDKSPKSSRF